MAAGRFAGTDLAVEQAEPRTWRRPASPRRPCWSSSPSARRWQPGSSIETPGASSLPSATRENLLDSLVAQAEARRFSGRVGQRFESLRASSKRASSRRELSLSADRVDRLRDAAIACMALPDLRETGRVIHRPAGGFIVAVDPASLHYALRFPDRVQVHRVSDDVEVDRFPAQGDRDINVFGFSPDGKYLATTHFPGYALTVRDVESRAAVLQDPGPVSWTGARFSPDSRRMALMRASGEMLVYALPTGTRFQSWPGPAEGADIAYRADGAVIATLHNQPGQLRLPDRRRRFGPPAPNH